MLDPDANCLFDVLQALLAANLPSSAPRPSAAVTSARDSMLTSRLCTPSARPAPLLAVPLWRRSACLGLEDPSGCGSSRAASVPAPGSERSLMMRRRRSRVALQQGGPGLIAEGEDLAKDGRGGGGGKGPGANPSELCSLQRASDGSRLAKTGSSAAGTRNGRSRVPWAAV